jgi:extradiol dioxygenase
VIRNLAYIGFRSPAAAEWRTFGPDVLGAELAPDGPGGEVRLRVDDAPHRISVQPGAVNELAYLGWEVDDIDDAVAILERAGIAAARRDDAVEFTDPFGFHHELTHELAAAQPFVPARPMSGFVTGAQGLGHAVLIVPDLDVALGFYTDVLGFKLSDSMGEGIRFLHCAGNAARHHTLAIAHVPGMVGIHHLMLEVKSLDDVGTALDVVNERKIPLAMTLGRHTNDFMTSFYVRTPSGFEIEYGTGGRLVDDRTWEVAVFDGPSIWGHKGPDTPLFPEILRPFEAAGASQ